jgi:hypothetical protein
MVYKDLPKAVKKQNLPQEDDAVMAEAVLAYK